MWWSKDDWSDGLKISQKKVDQNIIIRIKKYIKVIVNF